MIYRNELILTIKKLHKLGFSPKSIKIFLLSNPSDLYDIPYNYIKRGLAYKIWEIIDRFELSR